MGSTNRERNKSDRSTLRPPKSGVEGVGGAQEERNACVPSFRITLKDLDHLSAGTPLNVDDSGLVTVGGQPVAKLSARRVKMIERCRATGFGYRGEVKIRDRGSRKQIYGEFRRYSR